jgi:hypothetical protein
MSKSKVDHIDIGVWYRGLVQGFDTVFLLTFDWLMDLLISDWLNPLMSDWLMSDCLMSDI